MTLFPYYLPGRKFISAKIRKEIFMRRTGHLVLFAAVAAITQPAWAQEATTRLEDTGKEFVIRVGPVDLPVHMEMDGLDIVHSGIYPPIGNVTVPRVG